MTPEHEKIWKDACNNAKKEKGYVPAELLMLPMFVGLAEEGIIDVAIDGECTIIATKETMFGKGLGEFIKQAKSNGIDTKKLSRSHGLFWYKDTQEAWEKWQKENNNV